jgi:hypothetical protein
VITWNEIEAECGGYRAGFVEVFRRHEGQPTDEKDARGRVIKVTQSSFARHLGIHESTFRKWLKSGAYERTRQQYQETRGDRLARSAVRNDPAAVIDAIMEAPVERQDEIYHELKLRRSGEDRSTAHRKAVEAQVDEIVEPIRRSAAAMGVLGMAEMLDSMAHDLEKAADEGADLHILPLIRAAWERFGMVLETAEITTGVRR